jgi:integrase
MTAGPAWQDGDFVWCQPNGRPIGARADWDEWNELLKATAIRRVRVHDARHAAATLLLAQGVDQRVVMEILGVIARPAPLRSSPRGGLDVAERGSASASGR